MHARLKAWLCGCAGSSLDAQVPRAEPCAAVPETPLSQGPGDAAPRDPERLVLQEQNEDSLSDELAPIEEVSRSTGPSGSSASALQAKLRVDFQDLTFHKLIGKGSFKSVWRGRWGNTNVAIVSMRKGGMVTEARVMQRLSNHPNMVQFYRWSSDDKGNEYMVIELVTLGSLDKLLLAYGNVIRTRAKLMMCEQICSAMCELASEGVLHRDLAARNILVQSMDPVHVKVTDFGLARMAPGAMGAGSDPDNVSISVPVRWCPPEVLIRGEWSEKSDVWSFGVTMWEVFSDGAEPFARKLDEEVVAAVLAGEQLPRPPRCPKELYKLMQQCWIKDPRDRPNFATIARVFKRWREDWQAAQAAQNYGDDTGLLPPLLSPSQALPGVGSISGRISNDLQLLQGSASRRATSRSSLGRIPRQASLSTRPSIDAAAVNAGMVLEDADPSTKGLLVAGSATNSLATSTAGSGGSVAVVPGQGMQPAPLSPLNPFVAAMSAAAGAPNSCCLHSTEGSSISLAASRPTSHPEGAQHAGGSAVVFPSTSRSGVLPVESSSNVQHSSRGSHTDSAFTLVAPASSQAASALGLVALPGLGEMPECDDAGQPAIVGFNSGPAIMENSRTDQDLDPKAEDLLATGASAAGALFNRCYSALSDGASSSNVDILATPNSMASTDAAAQFGQSRAMSFNTRMMAELQSPSPQPTSNAGAYHMSPNPLDFSASVHMSFDVETAIEPCMSYSTLTTMQQPGSYASNVVLSQQNMPISADGLPSSGSRVSQPANTSLAALQQQLPQQASHPLSRMSSGPTGSSPGPVRPGSGSSVLRSMPRPVGPGFAGHLAPSSSPGQFMLGSPLRAPSHGELPSAPHHAEPPAAGAAHSSKPAAPEAGMSEAAKWVRLQLQTIDEQGAGCRTLVGSHDQVAPSRSASVAAESTGQADDSRPDTGVSLGSGTAMLPDASGKHHGQQPAAAGPAAEPCTSTSRPVTGDLPPSLSMYSGHMSHSRALATAALQASSSHRLTPVDVSAVSRVMPDAPWGASAGALLAAQALPDWVRPDLVQQLGSVHGGAGGPHMFFDMRQGGACIDASSSSPLPYLDGGNPVRPLDGSQLGVPGQAGSSCRLNTGASLDSPSHAGPIPVLPVPMAAPPVGNGYMTIKQLHAHASLALEQQMAPVFGASMITNGSGVLGSSSMQRLQQQASAGRAQQQAHQQLPWGQQPGL